MLNEYLHGRLVFGRRTRVLSRHLADLVPGNARLLDIGCGDGQVAHQLMHRRPDIDVTGVDVVPREQPQIAVTLYDGKRLPFEDASFDAVMFIDVLHHADDPAELLREGFRVAASALILKDHLLEGIGARPTLRLMDIVGNARFGVHLPYQYWNRATWRRQIGALGLEASAWREKLGLYPRPFGLLFERSLHFMALLRKA